MTDIATLSRQFVAAANDRGVDAPEPGLHPGVAAETYHAWRAASNSRLSKLRKSPAHLKAYMDEPPQDTAALIMGRAIHSAILEPDDFQQRYVMAPEGLDRRTNAGKERWKELVAQFGDGYVLKAEDYTTALRVRDSVYRVEKAAALLTGLGQIELSMTWNDADSGVRCKARLDRASIRGGAIVDLKTTRDASRNAFERSLFTLGYHRQGALYLQGAAANDLKVDAFAVIAVEKEPPYGVMIYRLTEGALDAGAEQLKPLLARYAECDRTNTWPGYPGDVQDIALPTWAWDEIAEETGA